MVIREEVGTLKKLTKEEEDDHEYNRLVIDEFEEPKSPEFNREPKFHTALSAFS